MPPRTRICGAGLVGLALSAALAPSALGATRIETAGERPFQRWVDKALVPTPDAVISVVEEPCPFAESSACTQEGTLTIWIGPEAGRAVFLHELGHQFDYLEMDEAERDGFRRLARERREWRSPPNSPHENFAEAYALCARKRHLRRPPRMWLAGFRPIVRRYGRACRRIRAAYEASAQAEGGGAVVTTSAGPGSA
jgi:hypothetical protein